LPERNATKIKAWPLRWQQSLRRRRLTRAHAPRAPSPSAAIQARVPHRQAAPCGVPCHETRYGRGRLLTIGAKGASSTPRHLTCSDPGVASAEIRQRAGVRRLRRVADDADEASTIGTTVRQPRRRRHTRRAGAGEQPTSLRGSHPPLLGAIRLNHFGHNLPAGRWLSPGRAPSCVVIYTLGLPD
jgi:hypothetical protein